MEYTSADLESRGWTKYAINKFLTPSRIETTRGYYRHEVYYYTARSVAAAKRKTLYLEYQAKLVKKASRTAEELAAAADRAERRAANAAAKANAVRQQIAAESKIQAEAKALAMTAKYGSWQAALPLACEYMFSLNRWAFSHKTTPLSAMIYQLKNHLIKLLYGYGYCTECIIHTSQLPAKGCFGCDGMGFSDDGDKCWRCDGTGVYRPATNISFVAFRFVVDGRTFAWHQPKHIVNFPFVATDAPADYKLPTEEKNVLLAPEMFAEAIELIEWIISENKG
jgi:hypothetical protein